MSIRANITTDVNGDIIIYMNGGLDYENSFPLEQELEVIRKEHPTATITIDMHRLDFVGSSGIGKFVETIHKLRAKTKQPIKITNVKNEFRKIFKHYSEEILTLIVDEFETEENNVVGLFGRRSKFDN